MYCSALLFVHLFLQIEGQRMRAMIKFTYSKCYDCYLDDKIGCISTTSDIKLPYVDVIFLSRRQFYVTLWSVAFMSNVISKLIYT